ncbi:MAG: matrixin family metalloprotease [Candidatus Woykebacteria bacterium]
MTVITRYRFLLSLLLAILFLLLLASPLADGGVSLKIYERKIKPKTNHRNNLIVCNVTDKDSDEFGVIGTKLPSNTTYRVNPYSAPSSVRNNLSTIVADSFESWDAVTSGISFTKGANTSVNRARRDGQNIIAWNRLSSNTLGATYIWYNSVTGAVVEVDTIMNSRQSWKWTNPTTLDPDQECPTNNAYDAQNILVHELGHWVGLEDLYSSNEEDLTMYGYGSKQELKKDTLESGDSLGAGEIYP